MKHHDPAAIRRAKIIRTIVMVLLCIISLLPFYLMFVNGTRTSNEVKSGISFWFGSNLLENLRNFDLKQRGLGVAALGSMFNSLLVTVPATALSVYFSALTAYGIHAYDFKLKKAAWSFILAVMMVPTQVFAIGYYKFMIQLKLIDTYWPLIIPAITTPVVVFFLRQYLLGAPLFGTTSPKEFGARVRDGEWAQGSAQWLNGIVLRHVKAVTGVDGITTEDLRHVGASLDLNSGLPLDELQYKLGHKDIKSTQRATGMRQGRAGRGRALLVFEAQDKQAEINAAILAEITGQQGEKNRP